MGLLRGWRNKKAKEMLDKTEEKSKVAMEKEIKTNEDIVRLKIIKNVYREVLKNQKMIEDLKTIDNKKEAMIQNILDIREMDMIELGTVDNINLDKLEDEKLKDMLMQEDLDTVTDLFEQLLEVLRKELGD